MKKTISLTALLLVLGFVCCGAGWVDTAQENVSICTTPEPGESWNPYAFPLSNALIMTVEEACAAENVPVPVALAVIWRESGAREGLVVDGCYGLMMVHGINKARLRQELGITDLRDSEQNIRAGVHILGEFLEKYGDLHRALVCYNCGETGAAAKFRSGVTQTAYSRAVLTEAVRLYHVWQSHQSPENTPGNPHRAGGNGMLPG